MFCGWKGFELRDVGRGARKKAERFGKENAWRIRHELGYFSIQQPQPQIVGPNSCATLLARVKEAIRWASQIL
jgi:hypothetical protein